MVVGSEVESTTVFDPSTTLGDATVVVPAYATDIGEAPVGSGAPSYRVTASIGVPLRIPKGSFDALEESARRAVAESLAEGMHRGLCETAREGFEPFLLGGAGGGDPVEHCMRGGSGGLPTVVVEFQIDSRLWPNGTRALEYPYVGGATTSLRKLLADVFLRNRAELAISFPELGSAERVMLDLREQGVAVSNVETAVKSALMRNEAKIGASWLEQFVAAVANSTVVGGTVDAERRGVFGLLFGGVDKVRSFGL